MIRWFFAIVFAVACDNITDHIVLKYQLLYSEAALAQKNLWYTNDDMWLNVSFYVIFLIIGAAIANVAWREA
jgi:hypothetical protein